jgi:hypothetical protein
LGRAFPNSKEGTLGVQEWANFCFVDEIKAEKEGPDSFAAFLPPELLLGVHPSSLLLD